MRRTHPQADLVPKARRGVVGLRREQANGAEQKHIPILQVYRRATIELELRVVEDGLPVTNAPLTVRHISLRDGDILYIVRTLLQPSTSILVSSVVHFFLIFFSEDPGNCRASSSGRSLSILLILPFFSELAVDDESAAE